MTFMLEIDLEIEEFILSPIIRTPLLCDARNMLGENKRALTLNKFSNLIETFEVKSKVQ